MKFFVMLLLLLFSISTTYSMSVQNGTVFNGNIAAMDMVNVTFQTTAGFDGVRVEIAGNPNLGSSQFISFGSPPVLLQQFGAALELMTGTTDFTTGTQTTGFLCPSEFTPGDLLTFTVRNQASTPQDYSLLLTNNDININGVNVTGEICCRGNLNSGLVAEVFTFDIPSDAFSLFFSISISGDLAIIGNQLPRFIARYDDCPSDSVDPPGDYILELPNGERSEMIINENSDVPLRPGQRLLVSLVRPTISDVNSPITYEMSSCSNLNCDTLFGSSNNPLSSSGAPTLRSSFFIMIQIIFIWIFA